MALPDKDLDGSIDDRSLPVPPLSDDEIVARVLAGERSLFELIMRRYNQRMFRIVRSIVGDDHEAEDVVQEAYVRAFEHLAQFSGNAAFSTWLTKIALHEALARRSQRQRLKVVDLTDPENNDMISSTSGREGEHAVSIQELGIILTKVVDELPDDLRTVFTMRMVEGLDTNETAACLELTAANVKVRLHRARAVLRERIDERIGISVRHLYEFGGERCHRIVHAVMTRLTCQ